MRCRSFWPILESRFDVVVTLGFTYEHSVALLRLETNDLVAEDLGTKVHKLAKLATTVYT
jgi:hypothetical protein